MGTREELLGLPPVEGGQVEDSSQPVSTPEAAPQPEAPAFNRPRDEMGRFAPNGVNQQEQPQGEEPEQPTNGYVPVSVLQRMRQESQELKRRLQELEGRQQAPRQAEEQQQQLQQMTPQEIAEHNYRNEMLNLHEASARAAYGPQVVEAAKGWFQQVQAEDPELAHSIRNSPFPYEALVENFRAEIQAAQIMQLLQSGFDPTNPDEWALKRAQALAVERQAQAQQQQPRQNAPPKSIVGLPSSGGSQSSIPVGPGQAFDTTFR